MVIDLLLKSGAKFDRAEHNYLLGVIEDQKNKNEYVSYCEKIEKTLSLISRLKVLKKQTGENVKRGEKYVKYENCDYNNNLEHIYDTPEYGILGYDNSNDYISEHIYEEIDGLRVNKEALSSNMSRSSSVSSINSGDTGLVGIMIKVNVRRFQTLNQTMKKEAELLKVVTDLAMMRANRSPKL
ncbi:hypothetical protein [Wolbachia endosymbiont of Tettigetta isshikii]|uniref:hypothetical protein n=1 Tax=Wolbachia endosymbiont of Tettigetta isshikii TaxID=3239093 RepID=UPI0039818218